MVYTTEILLILNEYVKKNVKTGELVLQDVNFEDFSSTMDDQIVSSVADLAICEGE